MRGEHQGFRLLHDRLAGSSPHARGAQTRVSRTSRLPRIIPACAGSTRHQQVGMDDAWDHPRMRGEHPNAPDFSLATTGSSPHARGAQKRRLDGGKLGGIIPACAGSTFGIKNIDGYSKDHPRMRGEHVYKATFLSSPCGSSPHARGARIPY